jgi:predicted NAD/FAD-binding protein
MRIAIVGSGVSGLVAAHRLHPRHDVRVYEAAPRIGGHVHTVDVEIEGERHAVDTGFIVYNERTYPRFTRLLAEIGAPTQPSEMSFGLSCERSGLEWSSRGLRGVFAQPRNLLRTSFHRMLRDVLRFNRESRALLATAEEKASLGDYLCGAGYSSEFVEHYVLPMGAAIWSADPARFLRFPAASFVRFFENHGLLEASPRLPWRVVCGGSARYVERLASPFRERIRTGCPVRSIRRQRHRVLVAAADGVREFDHVILAVHSDQALALLADPSPLERQILSSIAYQENEVTLHTDTSLLPRSRRAWASWNYRVPRDPGGRVLVTYDMNRLQGLVSRRRLLVTLNGGERIAPERVVSRTVAHHPVFDAEALAAQKLHGEISGRRRTHYCGAWWGYGFHEDGVASALAACERLEAEAAR